MSAADANAGADLLPEGFERLEPLLGWSIGTETGRIRRRQASTFEELVALRDGLLPDLERIFAYLGPKGLDQLSPRDERLLFLVLSLAEVAPALEFYRQPTVIDGFDALRFLPVEDARLRPNI